MPEPHFFTSTLFWSIISFGILMVVLYKTIFPSIFSLLEEREKKIRGSIEDADRLKREAQSLLADYEAKLKGAAQEVNAMLEEARLQARKVVEDGQKKMEQNAERTMEDARSGIERERQAALKDIREATVELTLFAAEKILERQLTDTDHKRFIEQVVQEVAQGKK
jgi:F-type H+-transporting ATPase subunit b